MPPAEPRTRTVISEKGARQVLYSFEVDFHGTGTWYYTVRTRDRSGKVTEETPFTGKFDADKLDTIVEALEKQLEERKGI